MSANATDEVKARAKRFVSYRLPGAGEDAALNYVLWTDKTEILHGPGGATDVLKPHLIAVLRSVGPGTTLQGNTDTLIPAYVRSALPHWFGVLFMLTLLSAAMSTMLASSTMGTALGRDVRAIAPRARVQVHPYHRFAIIVGIVVALVLGSMFAATSLPWKSDLHGPVRLVLPLFVLGLFWRRMTKPAAVAAAGRVPTSGSGCCSSTARPRRASAFQAWFGKPNLVPPPEPDLTVVDPIVVALPLSLLTAVVVALITRPMTSPVDYVFSGSKPSA